MLKLKSILIEALQEVQPQNNFKQIDMFANSVKGVLGPPVVKFGPDKYFISSVYEEWKKHSNNINHNGLTLDQFKRWLIEAQRQGYLALARADLVGVMDPSLVQQSETLANPSDPEGARYHFVQDIDL